MDQETTLLDKARAGDQAAFGRLVRFYQVPVYNLAYRMLGSGSEAEDATQETFLRVYQHLHTYDGDHKLSSWILSIASHYCVDRLRRRRPSVALDDTPALQLPAKVDEAPERVLLRQEREQEIQGLLAQLPDTYRLVLVLRYWYDLSYDEIARVLGASESAVKSRLHRARQSLVERLGQRQAAALASGL